MGRCGVSLGYTYFVANNLNAYITHTKKKVLKIQRRYRCGEKYPKKSSRIEDHMHETIGTWEDGIK